VTRDGERVLLGRSTAIRLCRYNDSVVVKTLYASDRSLYLVRSVIFLANEDSVR